MTPLTWTSSYEPQTATQTACVAAFHNTHKTATRVALVSRYVARVATAETVTNIRYRATQLFRVALHYNAASTRDTNWEVLPGGLPVSCSKKQSQK